MPTVPNTEAVRVALLDLGECLKVNKVDLGFLARKLNLLQSSFAFSAVPPITSAMIGSPNIEDDRNIWHEFKGMFDVIRRHESSTQYSYIIGITHLCMTEKNEDSGGNWGDYFSLSDKERVAVISINHNVLKYNSPSKTVYQYLCNLIVMELLIMMCKKDLIHTRQDFCLFDDCVDRSLFARCIEIGKICEECHFELKKHNISDKMMADVLLVLKWCRSNLMKYSVVTTVTHPLTSLSVGAVLGWFCSKFVDSSYYLAVLCILLVPAFLYLYVRYISNRYIS